MIKIDEKIVQNEINKCQEIFDFLNFSKKEANYQLAQIGEIAFTKAMITLLERAKVSLEVFDVVEIEKIIKEKFSQQEIQNTIKESFQKSVKSYFNSLISNLSQKDISKIENILKERKE